MFSRNFVPLLLQFPTTEISLWINTYTCRAYFYSQSILLLQDTLRIFCAYCLAVLCHLNTPTDNFSHLSSIRSPPVDSSISQKCSKYHSIFRKSSGAFLLLKFLLACIMINLISPVILLASLVIISLSLLNHYVANACIP